MVGGRRRTSPAVNKTIMKDNSPDKDGTCHIIVGDDSSFESEIAQIRGRWELASVFNFLIVFEPVIGNDLKLTAEEIEAGLVKPNSSLAQLHIKLLKGIPPASKTLNGSDAWVTAVCNKIAIWWPWVAEGEMPLTAAKGEEISRYKELKPTTRLQILKALCEIRADQDDAVSYINDALKNGTKVSCFRKDKIGGDGNATSFWYDGGTVIGHRLYKEVNKTERKTKMKGKASSGPPASTFQWETLATNLKEFQRVVDELASSKVVGETAVGKIIETDFVPSVEKFQKKKERALKQRQRQERLLNDFRSYATGITRSCRNRRPVSYTFDEYDRAIDEAIEISKRWKTVKELRNEKHSNQGEHDSDGGSDIATDSRGIHLENSDSDMDTDSKDENNEKGDSLNIETESDSLRQDGKGHDNDDDDDDNTDDDDGNDSKSDSYKSNESENSGADKDKSGEENCSQKPVGTRLGKRLAGVMSHPVLEIRKLASKNRLRQRPTRNSAIDSVVPDSEDESLLEDTKGKHEDLSPVANSEEDSDG